MHRNTRRSIKLFTVWKDNSQTCFVASFLCEGPHYLLKVHNSSSASFLPRGNLSNELLALLSHTLRRVLGSWNVGDVVNNGTYLEMLQI